MEKIKTDLLLKHLFKNPATKLIEIILGKKVDWQLLQDTDLKIVKNREADLVVKLEDNTILHIEIQSTNDPSMPYRMFEYFYLITDKYKPILEISKIRNNIEEEIKRYIKQEDFEMPITIEWTREEIESYPVLRDVLKIGKEEGFKEGLQKGLKDSIIESLELKFGELPEEIKAKINSTDDIEALKEMRKKAILIQSLEEFT
jgi:predicted transposase YdaD